jgi:hypothetical protein
MIFDILNLELEMVGREVESSSVSKCAQTTNHSDGFIGEVAVVTPFFSRMHVTDMQLDERNGDGEKRIAEDYARVGIARRIDDDGINFAPSSLDAVDKGAFVVGLHEVELDIQICGSLADQVLDVCESCFTIEVWLARTKEVEIRSIDDED